MRKNKTKETTLNKTTALVFDRYYGNNTNAAAVIAGRLVIAAALSFFCMSYIFLIYDLPTVNVPFALISAGFAVVFSLLFAAVGRCAGILSVTLIGGFVILCSFNSFWQRFSYFVDALVLQCDGRLFATTDYTTHPFYMIMFGGKYTDMYTNGVVFGGVILCAVFALITAAGLIGKPNIIPSLAVFVILCSPVLAAERLKFGWELIPITALYAGFAAIGTYYRDGLAIRHVYAAGGYRRKVAMDQKRFNSSLRAQSADKRIASRGLYYSKYFASAMSAAAMFAVLGVVLSFVFKNSAGINYDEFFEKIQNINIGTFFGVGSPFKSGSPSNYFASPMGSIFKNNDRLRLTSPSNSTKEILRITKPVTSKPIYLRGDIGIEFDGTSWSSPVVEEPADWRGSGLDNRWLPVEVPTLVDASEIAFDFGFSTVGVSANVGVEYLCDTDVVFAPAYDVQYKAFTDPDLDVFGDYAARRKTDTAEGEILRYNALMPLYSTPDTDLDISNFSSVCIAYNQYDNFYTDGGTVTDGMNQMLSSDLYDYTGVLLADDDAYYKYKEYVNSHYLSVPESLRPELSEYITTSGLNKEIRNIKGRYSALFERYYDDEYSYDTRILIERFLSAKAVSDFLKDNYTYSLDARIDRRDPVMSFLNDAKEGHCSLYASAMTLILRDMGIPARYCTGFAANADQTTQILRSKDLHAWCEVYLDELGWVTFDPTAVAIGISGGTASNTSSDISSSTTVSSAVSSEQSVTSSEAQSSDTHDPSSDGSSSTGIGNSGNSSTPAAPEEHLTFAQVLPYILTILGICAGIALIVLIVVAYNNLRKHAYKQVQTYHRSENSDYVYAKLLAVLRLCGLVPQNGEQPHTFFERAEITLGCSVCDNYEILQRLAFGNAEFDISERAMLGRIFEQIYRSAEKSRRIIGKIRLRLLVLSKKV